MKIVFPFTTVDHLERNCFATILRQSNSFIARFLDGELVVEEEDLLKELGWRIRDVRVGPDGYLYVLPDAWGTQIIRVIPED